MGLLLKSKIMALKVIGKILEWGYPQIIHLIGFSIINLPFLGYAHLWKPSYRQFGSFRSPVSAVFAVAGHDNWDTFAVWLVMGRRLGIIKWMVWHCFCRRTTKPRKTLISFNIKIGIWTVVCFPNVFLLLIPFCCSERRSNVFSSKTWPTCRGVCHTIWPTCFIAEKHATHAPWKIRRRPICWFGGITEFFSLTFWRQGPGEECTDIASPLTHQTVQTRSNLHLTIGSRQWICTANYLGWLHSCSRKSKPLPFGNEIADISCRQQLQVRERNRLLC